MSPGFGGDSLRASQIHAKPSLQSEIATAVSFKITSAKGA